MIIDPGSQALAWACAEATSSGDCPLDWTSTKKLRFSSTPVVDAIRYGCGARCPLDFVCGRSLLAPHGWPGTLAERERRLLFLCVSTCEVPAVVRFQRRPSRYTRSALLFLRHSARIDHTRLFRCREFPLACYHTHSGLADSLFFRMEGRGRDRLLVPFRLASLC